MITVNSYFPLPNKHGVYRKTDAERFEYEDNNVWIEGYILEIGQDSWLASASYSIKKCLLTSGTQGVSIPIKILCPSDVLENRAEALDKMRSKIEGFIKTGRVESKSKSIMRSWNNIEYWVFSIERQLKLFG